jgi:hypothetical protein
MNIAIFGDSFANGETGLLNHLSHTGLTQYFIDDEHFVVNFSRQGNRNHDIGMVEDYTFYLRQNPHLKFDIAFVFETEHTRNSSNWIQYLRDGGSVREVDIHMAKEYYKLLGEAQSIYNVPIYLIGGVADTLEPSVVEEYGIKCICQSTVNLVMTGEHTIEEPVKSFVYPLPMFMKEMAEVIDDKEYFLKIEKMGSDRYQLMLDNPKYFYPDGVHPNRVAYKVLYEYLNEVV